MAVVHQNIMSTTMLKTVKFSYGNVRRQPATPELFLARNFCSYSRTTKTLCRKEIVKSAILDKEEQKSTSTITLLQAI